MSNLVEFAKKELELAGLFDKDSDYNGMIGGAVLKMVKDFADEGHSGFSAALTMQAFDRVARFLPLTPLTGEDDEWMELCKDGAQPLFQNKRCFSVFKDKTGAYRNIHGGREIVTFPYMPK